ncbi:MAG: Gfo/Idh/MocA family oxidoreductase [Burkholderiales bacterium]|nr:Gfo/Idh/MocA family oxidoreductase [Burkholderiales bacterium]
MPSANKLRVGFVGANGRWGPNAHAPALQRLAEAEIYAVCTAHADTAQAAADKYHVARAYSDIRAMGADPEVEAALIAVRVPAHHALTKAALDAGKHVYCEWPLGADTREAEELAALARRNNLKTMVGLQRRASPAYLYLRELVGDGYVGQVLAVHMTQMGSGVLTRTSDRTWQRDVKLGANTLTITFGHAMDALCMVAGELAEVDAVVSTQVPQWLESDTKRHVDVTSPDNVMLAGRLQSGAVVSVHLGIQPYHGSGYRLEIYGKDGTLMMIGGGEAGQEIHRRIVGGHKGDKAPQDLPVPERLKWVPEEVRALGPAYDVGQMWVQFAAAIRGGSAVEVDFDHAVRRHRMLDAIRRASETGQRQHVVL